MNQDRFLATLDTCNMVSPYLLRPVRTRDQALADMQARRKPSNVHSFFPTVSSEDAPSVARASAA